jgi:uncharacterized phage-like protein YoqJ
MNSGDPVSVWHEQVRLFIGYFVELSPSGHYVVQNPATGQTKKFAKGFVSLELHKNLGEFQELFAIYVALQKGEEAPMNEQAPAPAAVVTELKPEPAPPPLVIAITGHRPNKLGGYEVPNPTYDIVVKGLVAAFEHYKPAYVITGMALGTDQWAAEICVNMTIPFVAALPFRGQEGPWPPRSKARYQWLLSRAYQTFVISEGGFEGWKMQKRNEWMVNSAHMLVAVYNGDDEGGTTNCLAYAAACGKYIHYVPLPPAGMAVGEWFEKTYGGQPKTEPKPEPSSAPGTKRIVEL